jgi:hypothetical protein
MTQNKLSFFLFPEMLAICRLEPDADLPPWAVAGPITSITRTTDELSLVCRQEDVPAGIRCAKGWRCLKVGGPLDFALTGILASLALPLAQAEISIFVVSTFDTDYVLLRQDQTEQAIEVLSRAGHRVVEDATESR